MIDPTSAFASGVALLHLILLACVYFGEDSARSAYVSTVLSSVAFFCLLLSIVVLAEAMLAVAYIFLQGGPVCRIYMGTLLAALAMAGWATLASITSDQDGHQAGAVIFVAASVAYSAIFLAKAMRYKVFLNAMWTLTILAAILYIAFYVQGMKDAAALAEWISFTLQAATFLIFFWTNPLSEYPLKKQATSGPETAMPLLQQA